MPNQILIIDKEASHANALKIYLKRQYTEVDIASKFDEILHVLDSYFQGVIIGDPYLFHEKTRAFLKQFKVNHPINQVIIFTTKQNIDLAMTDFGSLATYYLEKPINSKALQIAILQAKKAIATEKQIATYSQRLSDLHNAQNLYHQLFNEVPCYISVQNRDLRLTATNTRFQKDFGSVIGGYCYQIYKHRSSPCIDCPVAATFSDGESHCTEEVVTTKKGRQYNVITHTAPIRDENGDIVQVMEMSTNITQIRQLQDHLASLGLMVGSMSHGIKGMLTALDGGIYQLESGLEKSDRTRVDAAFAQIKNMTERIKKMVLEILYYAKSRKLEYQLVDVTELARTVVSTVSRQAVQNGIQIETDIPSSLGMIEIDPTWMQAAIVNIVENAVDACLCDTRKKEHWVRFSVKENGSERVCFLIHDNGMGMDQETQEKMLTLFFSSKGTKGTGLGLFIANHVVQQHGGSISVQSTLHEGTLFTLCIPRNRVDSENGRISYIQ